MKKSTFLTICTTIIFVLFILNVKATSISVSGTISSNTTWSGMDTVKVTGNIVVNDGVTLTINPGILVEFQGYYYITVHGRLLAMGTASYIITFTVADTTGYHNYSHTGWNGLVFWNISSSNDTSKVVYCKLEYGKGTPSGGHSAERGGAICVGDAQNILIDHCDISHNYSSIFGGAIFLWGNANVIVTNCNVHDNYAVYDGGGIYVWNSITLNNCTISNNEAHLGGGGGVNFLQPEITCVNNLIRNNSSGGDGGGIYIDHTLNNSVILNNTICNNNSNTGGGIFFLNNPSPDFRNTIIYGNTASSSGSQLYFESSFTTNTYFYYCNIENYNGSGTGGSDKGHFTNCIDTDPLFENPENDLFSLMYYSPCLNKGDPATTNADAGLLDLAGNDRIFNGLEARIDIGAYEYQDDPTPIYLSLLPTDNSKIADTNPILEIQFSYDIVAYGGSINIYNADHSLFEEIIANNTSLVTINSSTAVIDPVNDFIIHHSYYILVDNNAFGYSYGYPFEGIFYDHAWNFELVEIDNAPGHAISFDGTNDYVETNVESKLNGSELTIEYWFKGTSTQSAVRQQAGSDYIVAGWNGKHILSNDGGTSQGIDIGSNAEDDNWHHIAMTWKQNTANGFTSYLDGQLIETRTSSNNPIPVINSNVFFGSKYGQSEFIVGNLDEIRVWNMERSATEIRENMYLSLNSNEPGLLCYWQCNEGTGTYTHDLISGFVGSLENMQSSNWITSTIPFGHGVKNTQMISSTGNVNYTGTDVSMDFIAKTGTDTIVVTRIDTMPNILPQGVDTVFDTQYWIVNKYGNGTFSTNLSFTINEDLTPEDESHPEYISLYSRSSNSDNIWLRTKTANSVDAASNTATFNEVSGFSQFILARLVDTIPPSVTCLSPPDDGTTINDQNLQIVFDKNVYQVSGKSIKIYQANGSLFEEFILPSLRVSGDGNDTITIDPTTDLTMGWQYYVIIDSAAYEDVANNPFAGITSPDGWNFSVDMSGHISMNTTWMDTITVTGDIYVDDGVTLTINPGTYVKFLGQYKIDVQGRLLATGTETDTIIFTAPNHDDGWHRIIFDNTPATNDSSKIMYCKLEYGNAFWAHGEEFNGGAMFVRDFNKLHVSNCNFTQNKSYLYGGAISCSNSDILLMNNEFSHNNGDYGGAIYCTGSDIIFISNLIHNNKALNEGGGIWVGESNPVFLNNTISNNSLHWGYGGGVFIHESSPTFRNNILFGNTQPQTNSHNQIFLQENSCDPNFYYCNIEGGKDAFDGNGSGENYNGNYENNIDEIPQFTGTGDHPYQIEITSPCHNTGDPATTIADVGSFDAAGDYRIQNERIDIGAYESYKTTDDFPGDALSFNGIDNYVNFGNDQTLDIANDITVQLWVKPDSVDNNCYVLKKGEIKLLHWDVSYESMSGKGFQLNLPGPNTGWWEFQYDMDYGNWYHVAWTFSSSGELKAYINGELTRQGNFPGSIQTNTDDLLLASFDGSQRYKGLIDEIRIWNTVLTANEIRKNMHLALTEHESNPLSYWQLNDGSGSTAIDISGESPGTLYNMNDNNWVNSTIAFGSGESDAQIVSTTGNVIFNNTGISMDFTTKTATDTIVVVRIDTIPNVNPEAVTTNFDSQYWVINKFGYGTLTTDITFTVNESFSALDESNPGRIKLYKRNSTSDSAWTYYANASQVDAATNSVTFDGISGFSQFIICRKAVVDTVPGNALEFDGINDNVFGTGIDTTLSAITIEAWIYHNSLPGTVQRYVTIEPEVAVLRHDGSVHGGYNELHFYIKESNGSLHSLRVDSIETTNEWMHITGTYDGSLMKLYLNGKLIKSASPSVGGLYSPNGDFEFSSSGETMDGKIDEIRIWNYARSEQDIRENMYRTSNGIEPGLVNYWQLNNGSGTTAVDIIAGTVGTLHNMDNDNWVTSTVPTGIGTSNSQIVSSTGTVDFSGTGLSMDFVNLGSTNSITATRIGLRPNIDSTENCTSFDSQYWVVVNYNADDFTANITFEVNEDFTVLDEIYPASIKLFGRSSNSDSAWILVDSAHSVNATEHKVTFNEIHHFSQFLIARGEYNEAPSPGNCLNFDGVNDYVSIPADTSLDNNEFTVEFWVSMSNPSEWVGILDKGRHTLSDWCFLAGKAGQEEGVIFAIGTGISPVPEIDFSWNDNHWHHIAGTYDGTTMKLYVDGILKGSRTVAMANTDNGIHVGNRLTGGYYFSGKLDEIRIWNVAISEAQIRENMHKPLIGTEDNLVSYWTFNESSGNIAHDLSNSNNGTLHYMTDNSWISSTAPVPYFTVNNGDWESLGNWGAGQNVPARSWARARISHNISLNSNKEVIKLTLKPTGILTLTNGFTLIISE